MNTRPFQVAALIATVALMSTPMVSADPEPPCYMSTPGDPDGSAVVLCVEITGVTSQTLAPAPENVGFVEGALEVVNCEFALPTGGSATIPMAQFSTESGGPASELCVDAGGTETGTALWIPTLLPAADMTGTMYLIEAALTSTVAGFGLQDVPFSFVQWDPIA